MVSLLLSLNIHIWIFLSIKNNKMSVKVGD